MVENDFRSISCEIMDRFRSNCGSILLVRPFVNNLQWVSCERNSCYSFWPIILKLHRCFSNVLKKYILFAHNSQIFF